MTKNNLEIKKRALDLYRPPFSYNANLGWIVDADDKHVANGIDVAMEVSMKAREWRGSYFLGDDDQLQSMVGSIIAEALTKYWLENK